MSVNNEGGKNKPVNTYPAEHVDLNIMVRRLKGYDYNSAAVKKAWDEFVQFSPRINNKGQTRFVMFADPVNFKQFFEVRLALLQKKFLYPDDSISTVMKRIVSELHEYLFKPQSHEINNRDSVMQDPTHQDTNERE